MESQKSQDFKQFLKEFCDEFKKKCETDDSIPLRVANPRITPSELEGECLDWCLDHLSARGCPTGFSSLIARDVFTRLLAGDLQQFCTENSLNNRGDSETTGGKDERNEQYKKVKEYDAEILQKHLLLLLEAVCKLWLANFPVFSVSGREPVVSFHAIKNTRRKMEDTHVIIPDLNALFGITDQPPQAFYAVFDGHAGTDAPIFAAKHLHCNLVHRCGLAQDPAMACKKAFKVTDEQFIVKAIQEQWRSGCTGVTALLRGSSVYLGWLGDSQAMLVKDGRVVTKMEPHKPERQDERDRIEEAGGYVALVADMWRVGGNLAVSRAIGDVQYKPFVSSDAEVLNIKFDGTEEYMVLACDGLWDAVTEQELPRLVYNYVMENDGDLKGVAKHLVQYAKDSDSQDNISVIVVFFRDTLMEPQADAVLFNFLGQDSYQDSNDSGNNKDDINKGSGNSGDDNDDDKSGRENGNGDGGNINFNVNGSCFGGESNRRNKDAEQTDNERKIDEYIDQELGVLADLPCEENDKSEENVRYSETSEEQQNNEIENDTNEPLEELKLRSFDQFENNDEAEAGIAVENRRKLLTEIDHKSFMYGTSNLSELLGGKDALQISESDPDYYGVFNTRLVDGPIDLDHLDEINSSLLLKDIAESVYKHNLDEDQDSTDPKTRAKINENCFANFDKDLELSVKNHLKTEKYGQKKREERLKEATKLQRRDPRGKGKSPVCWAFTGKNRASVQNYKLNLAAKSFHRGSNALFAAEDIPNVKPAAPKFAQNYSQNENVHNIANITMSHNKLDSLPPPLPKILPSSLETLSGFKVFGSKAGRQNGGQKFHTTWRPRKPLKPISSVVYETPPTPFMNSKIDVSRQH